MKQIALLCLVLLLGAMPMFAQSDIYFVQGAEWTFNVSSIYAPDYLMKHILDGKAQIGDKECTTLWTDNEDDLGMKKLKGYISTEGERVYYHQSEEDVEGSLLYDFGLEIGDTIIVPALYTDWDIIMKCVGMKTVVSCGRTYDVQLMATMNPEAIETLDLGQWFYGIGEIDYDSEYGNWGHGFGTVGTNSKVLQQVTVNGETIYDIKDVQTIATIALPSITVPVSPSYRLDGTLLQSPVKGLSIRNGRIVWNK